MPALAITVPAPPATSTDHPKAHLVTEDGIRYPFRFAPVEVEHRPDILTRWTEERPGRKPIGGPAGASLRTASFQVTVAGLDHQESVEADLEVLETIGRSAARVRLDLGPSEAGWWAWLADDGLTWVSVARQHGTNEVTQAIVTLSLVEAHAGVSNAGPVGGGLDWTGRLSRYRKRYTGQAGVRFHTVRAGDTLAKIATRYYGNVRQWRTIAEANGITNPRRQVIPGKRLRIP